MTDPTPARDERGIARFIRPLALIAAVVLALGVLAAAVSSDGEDADVPADEATSALPQSLDDARDWLLAFVNGTVEPTDAELRERFTASFLDAVPPDMLRSVNTSLRPQAPWTPIQEVERRDRSLAVQIAGAGESQARLTVALDAGGRIAGATVLMAESCAELVATEQATMPDALSGQLGWALDVLNSDRALTDAEIEEHLHSSFLTSVPPEEFRAAADTIRSMGPLTMRFFEGQPTASALELRVGLATGEEARLTLSIEPNAPHRILGLLVLTQQPCRL